MSRPKKVEKLKRNGNPIKNWFITFPQSGEMDRKEFIDLFPPYTEASCAREEHEDNGLHLHMRISLVKGLTTPKLKAWIEAKFPYDWKRIHFRPERSKSHAGDYCNKEDPLAIVIKKKDVDKGKKLEKLKIKIINDLNLTDWNEFLIAADKGARSLEEKFKRDDELNHTRYIEEKMWTKDPNHPGDVTGLNAARSYAARHNVHFEPEIILVEDEDDVLSQCESKEG